MFDVQLENLPDQRTSKETGEKASSLTVVLDTCVLISDPEALVSYGSADVVLPLTVIEELDNLKIRTDEVGWAARTAIRTIEEHRVEAGGDIRTAVALSNGGTFRVETNGLHLSQIKDLGLDVHKADNRILAAALGLAEKHRVKVVSNDAAMRIKAAQLGLEAVDYIKNGPVDEKDPGWKTFEVSTETIDLLYHQQYLSLEDLKIETGLEDPLYLNQAVVLQGPNKQSALGRRKSERIVLLKNAEAWGLKAKSKEQRFALDLLLDEDIKVVALAGRAGTGKTILGVAAALELVVEKNLYDNVGIYRPVVSVGKESDLGFLPGTLEEKLSPWMEAISDNIKALSGQGSSENSNVLEELQARGTITLGSVAHIRGRSISKSILIIDEAQSLEPAVGKALLTRVAAGTKVILTGDLDQIDSSYLSRQNNALSAIITAFKGKDVFGHMLLTQGERSKVADLAAELL